MSQEPDDHPLNNPQAGSSFDPSFPAPVQPPFRPAGPSHQQHQPIPPAPSAEDELRERLRALRQRRQQTEQGQATPSIEFQRHGLPMPPTPQPPLKDVLKHWWEHGPFSGSLPGQAPPEAQHEAERQAAPGAAPPLRRPGRPTGPLAPSGPLSPYQRSAQEPPAVRDRTGELPRRGGPTQPLDERAKELLNQSRETLAALNTHAQTMVSQAKNWLNERAKQYQPPAPPPLSQEAIVPGLVVIGFAPTISREEGIQRISALGGTPLRYKAGLNLFQVAVPPGQERAMIQRFLQQPEVVSAGVERPRPQQ